MYSLSTFFRTRPQGLLYTHHFKIKTAPRTCPTKSLPRHQRPGERDAVLLEANLITGSQDSCSRHSTSDEKEAQEGTRGLRVGFRCRTQCCFQAAASTLSLVRWREVETAAEPHSACAGISTPRTAGSHQNSLEKPVSALHEDLWSVCTLFSNTRTIYPVISRVICHQQELRPAEGRINSCSPYHS